MPSALFTRFAVGVAVASSAWMLLPTESFAGSSNLVHNPSFESYSATAHSPSCWVTAALGHNTGSVTRTTHAHNGSHAARLRITDFRSGGRLIATRRTAACALPAERATLAVWQHSTGGLRAVVSYRQASGWTGWVSVARVTATSTWRHTSVVLPVPPAGSKAMAVGFELTRSGAATVDTVTAYPIPVALTANSSAKKPVGRPSPSPSPTATLAPTPAAAATSAATPTAPPTDTATATPTATASATATPTPTVTSAALWA